MKPILTVSSVPSRGNNNSQKSLTGPFPESVFVSSTQLEPSNVIAATK